MPPVNVMDMLKQAMMAMSLAEKRVVEERLLPTEPERPVTLRDLRRRLSKPTTLHVSFKDRFEFVGSDHRLSVPTATHNRTPVVKFDPEKVFDADISDMVRACNDDRLRRFVDRMISRYGPDYDPNDLLLPRPEATSGSEGAAGDEPSPEPGAGPEGSTEADPQGSQTGASGRVPSSNEATSGGGRGPQAGGRNPFALARECAQGRQGTPQGSGRTAGDNAGVDPQRGARPTEGGSASNRRPATVGADEGARETKSPATSGQQRSMVAHSGPRHDGLRPSSLGSSGPVEAGAPAGKAGSGESRSQSLHGGGANPLDDLDGPGLGADVDVTCDVDDPAMFAPRPRPVLSSQGDCSNAAIARAIALGMRDQARELRDRVAAILRSLQLADGQDPSQRIHAPRLVRELMNKRGSMARARREEMKIRDVLVLVDTSPSCGAVCNDNLGIALALAKLDPTVIVLKHSNGFVGASLFSDSVQTRKLESVQQVSDPRVLKLDLAGVLALGDIDAVRQYRILGERFPLVWMDHRGENWGTPRDKQTFVGMKDGVKVRFAAQGIVGMNGLLAALRIARREIARGRGR